MICTPTNVYPNGQCVDGSKLFKLYAVFYGDNCISAVANFYDYETMEMFPQHRAFQIENGIKNGDTLSSNSPTIFEPKKEYLWNIRFYEEVDIDNGYYPTVYNNIGVMRSNPVVAVTINASDEESKQNLTETQFPLDAFKSGTNSFKPPFYVYWEGHGRRTVISYTKKTRCIEIDEPFSKDDKGEFVPKNGTKLYISNIKTNNYTKLIEETNVDPIENEQGGEVSTSVVFIEPGLNIEFGKHNIVVGSGGNYYDSYLKYLKNNTYYSIKEYCPLSGKLVLNESISVVIPHTYKIYYSFIDSPYYYFSTKDTPVITANIELNDNAFLNCTAKIAHEGDYSIDYYFWEVYDNGNLIKQSCKIYSGRLNYIFREIEAGKTYTAKITVKTKDGMTASSEEVSFAVPYGSDDPCYGLRAQIIDDINAVKLTWSNRGATFCHNIYRKDMATNKIKFLGTLYTAKNGAGRITEFYDYTCRNNADYVYIMRPVVNGVIQRDLNTDIITTNFSDWSIYFLEELPYTYLSFVENEGRYDKFNANLLTMQGDKRYIMSSIWKVQIQRKIDDIEHNMNRNAKETYYHKPVVTYGESRYDSFSLEFSLGEFTCMSDKIENADITAFDRWITDVDSKKPVMIKDSKGFVWFGHIVKHSYSTDYTVDDGLITIKIDFVQTADNKDVRILKDTLGVK